MYDIQLEISREELVILIMYCKPTYSQISTLKDIGYAHFPKDKINYDNSGDRWKWNTDKLMKCSTTRLLNILKLVRN